MVTRRELLLGGGALAGTAVGVAWWLTEDSEEPSERDGDPEHHIQVLNRRDTPQEVAIEGALDEVELSYGPRELAPGEDWEVDVIEREGELSLTFTVDGEVVWEPAHEVPNLRANRSSFVQLVLLPDGEVDQNVMVEQ